MVVSFLQMINLKIKPRVLSQFLSERDPYKVIYQIKSIIIKLLSSNNINNYFLV